MRRIVLALAVLGVMLSGKAHTQACGPFLGLEASPTLREQAAAARLVLYGTLANPRPRGGADSTEGTTDLRVLAVLKGSPDLKGRKVVELPRHIPVADPQNPPAFLIFLDLVKGKADPRGGVQVKSAAMVDYLKGAMALDPKKSSAFLSYFFRHLDHADREIADDALLEFARIDYRDVPSWAKGLPADKIAGWLEQPNLLPARVRLYAPLLGDCGGDRHAALLRRMLDQARKQEGDRGVDGLFLGYTILRPREGWAYLQTILGDPESPFHFRFQGLRATRFLWGARQGVVSKEKLVGGILLLVGQGDIADLAVEELRQWKQWEPAEQVLSYYGKASHAVPIIRRAIIRYALCCPDRPTVRMFLAERRRDAPEMVQETEETLALEGTGRPDSPLRP
jgi:hypothetical protein